jgi:hypothetical protein
MPLDDLKRTVVASALSQQVNSKQSAHKEAAEIGGARWAAHGAILPYMTMVALGGHSASLSKNVQSCALP